jgi:hypothetical protein
MLNHPLLIQYRLSHQLHLHHLRHQQYPLVYQKQHFLENLDLPFLNLQEVKKLYIFQHHRQNLQVFQGE